MPKTCLPLLFALLPLVPAPSWAEEFDGFREPTCASYLRGRAVSPIETVRDIYVDLAGTWTDRQIRALDEALLWPHEHRVRKAVTAAELEFPRYVVFFHGSTFSFVVDESADSHQYIFEIPTGASKAEIAAFVDGKLPAVLYKHTPAATPRPSGGERKRDDSSSSPAYDPPPMIYYPDGSGGGFWM